jgi:nitroimidazol reductase NimA-like FMN-containing flavoprotein (pyridoxamine 5'-phosphate oxidase superfamily)
MDMEERSFNKSKLNTIKRIPKRGHYDKTSVYKILDDHFLCHISWEDGGQPLMIPTAYGRKGDKLYIHGSSKSRMLNMLADGRPICFVVTHLDALVLARSVFHHSMNYRSAVIYGHAQQVEGEEKMEALRVITEQIIPGRWDEARLPNEIEMKATTALAIDIDTASAKIRTGPPADDTADYDLPIWAGIVPLKHGYYAPVTDPDMKMSLPIDQSAIELVKKYQKI